MQETQATVEADVTRTVEATTPKSVAQRASRKRFSFGPVWNKSVVEGQATDVAKLVEQAVKLKVGSRSDLKKLKLATLRNKVAAKLQTQTALAASEQA